MSRLFPSGGQRFGSSASASILQMNIQGWFPLALIGLIFLLSEQLSRVFASITIKSISSLVLSLLYGPTLTSICDYRKNHSFDYTGFVGKVTSSSVQFNHSIVSDSLWPHELQHSRLPCPTPIPGAYSNSCPLSQWCHPTISSFVTLFSWAQSPIIRVFSNELFLRIRWPKYCSFSFSISPSNEYSGLISFRIDWFDLLTVQRTLKRLQHHSSKASILQWSAFFMVQLTYPYMTTVKTIALTMQTFVSKVMSLLLITLAKANTS